MKVSEAKALLEGLPDNMEVKLEILRDHKLNDGWVTPKHDWYPVDVTTKQQGGQHIGPVIW
jgi:hypothetical protein